MKKLNSCALLLLLLSYTFTSFSQTVHYDYQDGLVVFQLKENAKIINTVNDGSRVVNYKDIPLFKNLSNYVIIEVLRLHPDIKDEKLRRTYQIQLEDMYLVDALINQLKAHPAIEYAELKELHRKFLTPNDLGPNTTNNSGTNPTGNQWALHTILAQQAWDLGTGDAQVIAAVTDDAFVMNHVDLVNKYVSPYDAVTQGTNPSPCGSNVGNHGTHVAGTVGAETNNGTGVASIGFNVSVMPIKIGNCNNQLTHGYEGITYAANNGAHVVNMSWGGGGFCNYGQNVCNYAWNQGTILVAAAGNNNASTVFYPAGYNNVIAVASTTPTDARSGFSQYGTWINIAAPGSNIRSTYATTLYNSISGTSMASPHVTGLLALMRSAAPNATNTDLINCLYSGADNIDAANPNFIGQLGAGRINAYNSMVCASQYAASYDAAIVNILSPGSAVCAGSFTPVVELRNFGSQTLTSVTITYSWGAGDETFNWTGNLTTGNTMNVTLPNISVGNGSYTFTASTSLPNGEDDENPTNDSSDSEFTIDSDGQEVSLTIITDCWGSETTWQVVNDDNGAIEATGGPYLDGQPLSEQNHEFCLATGCYTFTIFDAFGDGMNGAQWQSCSVNGDYFMAYENGDQIFEMTAANANFGNSAVHPFCIIPQNNFDDAGIIALISPSLFVCSANVSPVVRLRNFGLNTLTSTTISYSVNGGAVQLFNWSGSLASGLTTDVTLPAINTTNGMANFIASTSLPNGEVDNNPSNDETAATFAVNASAASVPFVESFETDVLANGTWKILNPDSDFTWEFATVGGITPGNQAMKLDFFNYSQASQRDGLISPKIDLNGLISAEMTFHHAYRRFNQSATDSLIIYVSTNCGDTWTRVFEIAENGTGTFATQTTNENAFTPAQAADWCFQPINNNVSGASCYEIDLTPFVGQEVVIMFEAFNAGTLGNNLYLDNINIDGVPGEGFPTANFNSGNTTICPGQTIQYNNQSTGDVTSYAWSFPGGTPNSSTVLNPIITYNNPGTFNVTLTVTNTNGSNTSTQNNYVVVNPAPTTPNIVQNGNQLSVILMLGETATWSLNGSTIGNGSSIIIDTPGNYTVEVVNQFGCRVISDMFNVLSTPEDALNQIVVYPNPSGGLFTILLGQVETFKLQVLDLQGRLVLEQNNIESTEYALDLSHLSKGSYILILQNAQMNSMHRLQLLE